MRHTILAALLVAAAPAAFAVPVPKDQLLVPAKDAAHYVVVSTAGKHGDEYMWTLPDGRLALRQSILLRGLIFETDETIRFGADKMPSEIVIRGVTPSGDDPVSKALHKLINHIARQDEQIECLRAAMDAAGINCTGVPPGGKLDSEQLNKMVE